VKPQSRYLLPSAGPTSHLAEGNTLGEKNGINNCDKLSCASSYNYFLLIRNVIDEVVAEMKCVISKLFIALSFTLLQINSASANQPIKMLTFDGLAKYADRFEILPSDDCKSFEMRSWGRVVDKDSNDLSRNDMIDLILHSGPVNIVQAAQVISISKNIDDNFDVVYLSFGNWSWDTEKVFTELDIESLTAIHFDKKVNIEANIWNVPELPAQLKNLRKNCIDIPKVGEI
jgi:hypothetical protein